MIIQIKLPNRIVEINPEKFLRDFLFDENVLSHNDICIYNDEFHLSKYHIAQVNYIDQFGTIHVKTWFAIDKNTGVVKKYTGGFYSKNSLIKII